jgi:lipoprotein-releasing system permease protein
LIFEFFKKYLFSKNASSLIRTISWLCLVNTTVGVMGMLVIQSVMTGFGNNMRDRLLSFEPHLIFETESRDQREKLLDTIDKSELAKEKTHSNVYETQDILVKTSSGYHGGAISRGLPDETLSKLINSLREAERKRSSAYSSSTSAENEKFELAENEVLVGIDLARALGIFEGDELIVVAPESLLLPKGETPKFARVFVKGFLRTDIGDWDRNVILHKFMGPLRGLGRSASYLTGVEVRLKDANDYQKWIDKFGGDSRKSESWASRNSALFYSLRMEKFLMTLILSLTVLIGSFSIITVLVLLGTQKRKDMGLLMAVGLSPKRAKRLIAGVGLFLSGIGILLGLFLGLAFCWTLDNTNLITLPDYYYDRTIPAKVELSGLLVVLGVSSVIAALSAWIPASLTALKSPVAALRPKQGSGL